MKLSRRALTCSIPIVAVLLAVTPMALYHNRRQASLDHALIDAAESGRLELVKLLVEHGADLEFRNGSGQTPLIVASLQGQTDVVAYLLNHGANIEASDK